MPAVMSALIKHPSPTFTSSSIPSPSVLFPSSSSASVVAGEGKLLSGTDKPMAAWNDALHSGSYLDVKEHSAGWVIGRVSDIKQGVVCVLY